MAIYVRWSTEEQGEGHTLAIQLERCRHYLRAQGWTEQPDLVFVDDGYSGGSLRRPGLDRLRRAVQDGRVDCVVVYRLDRLSRNLADTVELVHKEWAGRCAVRSCTEDINTVSPAGRMFFNMLVSFAEYERGLIRERTRAGKLKNAEAGRNPGITPAYGYRRGGSPGPFAVDEEAAAVVRRVFAAYEGGRGVRQIAAGLNAAGIAAPRGDRWYPQVVRYLLHNPAYAGVLRYGGLRVPGAWPPIIAPDRFRRVQDLLRRRGEQARRGRKPTYAERYLLSGHARCPCGGSLVPAQAGPNRYYRCARALAAGPVACDCGSLPMAAVDRALTRALLGHLGATPTTGVLARLRARLAAERRAAARALARQRLTVAGLRRRLRRSALQADLSAALRAAEEEAAVLLRRRARIEAAIRLLAPGRCAGGAAGVAWGPGAAVRLWQTLPMAERRRLVQALTVTVLAYRQRTRRPARSRPGPPRSNAAAVGPAVALGGDAGVTRPDTGPPGAGAAVARQGPARQDGGDVVTLEVVFACGPDGAGFGPTTAARATAATRATAAARDTAPAPVLP